MTPLDIFGWTVLAGAIITVISFVGMFFVSEFAGLFVVSGLGTSIAFVIYVIIWVVAKALKVI